MHWQHDPERRALAQYRVDRNRPALHLDHALRDRQAQAGTAFLARIGIVDLLKLAEDPFLIGGAITILAFVLVLFLPELPLRAAAAKPAPVSE